MTQLSSFSKTICLALTLLITLTSCASQVIISQPYPDKLRVGDGVKLVVKDGTIHSGRIVYIDRASVVIRTPKQKTSGRPVEISKFGTTVPWSEVVRVRVAGTLDNRQQLISNEEIRVNVRTTNRRNYAINIGLLGIGLSFLSSAYLQDRISPLSPPFNDSHHKGRATFWSTFITGSVASIILGYKFGEHFDRQISIDRIERSREKTRQAIQALSDSLQNPTHMPALNPLK